MDKEEAGMADLSGKKVAVVATDYFEEAELTEPVKALREAGAKVEIIAPEDGKIKGLKHVEPGESVSVDKTLEQANPNDYDAAVFPGGAVNADQLRVSQKARDFLTKIMDEQGKPTAIICHAPWMLASAGLARGRKLTSYHTIADDMRNAGADWVDEEVVVDGNLITSRDPDDLPAFNKALISALAG
ncbi:MAG TPA: type 1 glutamine amidotransferase domain-containing protein [Candidatus Saccharimonadales bacterium]|nr:type 1 glutamine amidotransferase domain-containing protein [Candidatus Saccharimonadales bacterium]